MPRIPLLGGAYSQASVIAGAQRCINLYPETNPQSAQAPVNVTHYSRPGRTALGAGPPVAGPGRCLYTSSVGDLYAVVGQALYFIDPNFVWTNTNGLLPTQKTTPVYMADNGVNALVVDGGTFAVNLTLATRSAQGLTDPNFLGADRVSFIDYFLALNEPGTPNWYTTQAQSAIFNALLFGTKTRWPDNVTSLIASEDQVWIFGPQKGEIWDNAGLVPFSFQAISGTIIDHGIVGPYALNRWDVNVYWLSQAPEGGRMALRGVGNSAQRISTHAIEDEWLTYPRVDDCIVTTMLFRGHGFVFFDFPTADRTWIFDETTQQWHEEAFFDVNGVQHRMRDTMKAFAYGKNLSLDWQTGQLYLIDETNFTDNGTDIRYIRGFPHLVSDEFDRITLWRVIADMECGNGPGFPQPTTVSPWSLGFNAGFGPQTLVEPPQITLDISRDRGRSFYVHDVQPLGARGQYFTKPTFNRCGYGYDLVPQLRWSSPIRTALNGVFAVIEEHEADE